MLLATWQCNYFITIFLLYDGQTIWQVHRSEQANLADVSADSAPEHSNFNTTPVELAGNIK